MFFSVLHTPFKRLVLIRFLVRECHFMHPFSNPLIRITSLVRIFLPSFPTGLAHPSALRRGCRSQRRALRRLRFCEQSPVARPGPLPPSRALHDGRDFAHWQGVACGRHQGKAHRGQECGHQDGYSARGKPPRYVCPFVPLSLFARTRVCVRARVCTRVYPRSCVTFRVTVASELSAACDKVILPAREGWLTSAVFRVFPSPLRTGPYSKPPKLWRSHIATY